VEMQRALGKGVYKMVSDRYGGWENIKKTVSEDPVGFASDVSAILTGGGRRQQKSRKSLK